MPRVKGDRLDSQSRCQHIIWNYEFQSSKALQFVSTMYNLLFLDPMKIIFNVTKFDFSRDDMFVLKEMTYKSTIFVVVVW